MRGALGPSAYRWPMAVWRRRALEVFPECAHDGDALRSAFALCFWLLPATRDAHRRGDVEFLGHAYDYAQWAHHQRAGSTLGNTVDVGFYEHLFDDWSLRKDIAPWLSTSVRHDLWSLWAQRLEPDHLAELRHLFAHLPSRRT